MSPDTDSAYAIVKTGGKQYSVRTGEHLLVERLAVEEGRTIDLQPLMYRAEEIVFDREGLAKVKVTAKVIAHERGEKLRVFKFKPKRGYRRRTGHRQELTRIEVTGISHSPRRAAPAKGEAPEGGEAPAKRRAAPAKQRAAPANGEAAAAKGEAATAKPKAAAKRRAAPAKGEAAATKGEAVATKGEAAATKAKSKAAAKPRARTRGSSGAAAKDDSKERDNGS
jgi:large subunit ribosomal protein L21